MPLYLSYTLFVCFLLADTGVSAPRPHFLHHYLQLGPFSLPGTNTQSHHSHTPPSAADLSSLKSYRPRTRSAVAGSTLGWRYHSLCPAHSTTNKIKLIYAAKKSLTSQLINTVNPCVSVMRMLKNSP